MIRHEDNDNMVNTEKVASTKDLPPGHHILVLLVKINISFFIEPT